MTDLATQSLLTALQLADSFFPSGMYAHSHGLEGMVSRGLVTSAAQVAEFLANQFTWSIVPSDGVALLEAHRAAERGELSRLIEIDRLLLAMKLPAELRAASTQLGRRVLVETESWVSGNLRQEYGRQVFRGLAPGNGSVALGVTGRDLGLGCQATLMVFCHGHAVSVLGAAVRLLPLTHTEAQSILRGLNPLLARLTREYWECAWQDMTAFTPELDLVSLGHESDELRLFAS
jgi:urease accessory protein